MRTDADVHKKLHPAITDIDVNEAHGRSVLVSSRTGCYEGNALTSLASFLKPRIHGVNARMARAGEIDRRKWKRAGRTERRQS